MKNQFLGSSQMKFGLTACSRVSIFALLIFISCLGSDSDFDDISNDLLILSQAHAAKYGKIGISDSANDGIDEFYFLMPTVAKNPRYSGKFNSKLSPIVEISDDLGFNRIHQIFKRSGQNNLITVSETEEQYVLSWDTSKSKAELGKIYRVRVRVGEKILGYIDVAIVAKKHGKVNGSLVQLEQNQSMRIHFRLEEKNCPSYIRVTPSSPTIFVGQNQQFTAKVYNFYNELLEDIKVNWSVNDEEIASIDKNGNATAISVGYTKIFTKALDVTGEANLYVGDDKEPEFGSFTDQRDGQVYKTIKIGDQIWMAQNLNFLTENSYCYGNNSENCEIFGRLYKWEAVKNVCPEGWFLPNDEDWEELGEYLGGRFVSAGGKMKSVDRWLFPNIGATNESGFSALPSGIGEYDGFNNIGNYTLFWSSSETVLESEGLLGGFSLTSNNPHLQGSYFAISIGSSFSCRCLKDN